MGGSRKPEGTNAPAVPSWQRKDAKGSLGDTEPSQDSTGRETRTELVEQAAKFLENEDVRIASDEQKWKFLKTKGLNDDEVRGLLGTAQHLQPLNASREGLVDEQDDEVPLGQDYIEDPEMSLAASPAPPPASSGPPIITYPEFLLHSQKPPPLVTTQRLFTTLYILSAAAATIYGTSKYIFRPMLDSLTQARHSLFETASVNLESLNERLEKTVSSIPDTARRRKVANGESDATSLDSDPDVASFFQRSAATQTSPRTSRSSSSASVPSTRIDPSSTAMHHTALQSLLGRLSELRTPQLQSDSAETLDTRFKNARKTVEERVYGHKELLRMKVEGGGEDEIVKVKNEIRGMKSVLLSARNFPAPVGGRMGR